MRAVTSGAAKGERFASQARDGARSVFRHDCDYRTYLKASGLTRPEQVAWLLCRNRQHVHECGRHLRCSPRSPHRHFTPRSADSCGLARNAAALAHTTYRYRPRH